MTGVRARDAGDRFGLVFALLMSSFVFGAVATDPRGQALVLVACVASLLLVLRVTAAQRWMRSRLGIVLCLVTVSLVAAAVATPGDAAAAALALWLAVVVAATILAILRRVLSHPAVTMQTVFGGLSAYLLIGFLFTALYSVMVHTGSVHFFAGDQSANPSTLQYFSFVTLTTTGYGDLAPAGSGPRSLAVLEALMGQIFLVTLVSRLVAMFGQPRRARQHPPAAESGAADR
jgi:hypothetical protein